VVRSRIKVAMSPPPPADLAERLGEMRRYADAGDGQGIVRVVRALVPTYREDRASTTPAPTPPEPEATFASLAGRRPVETFRPGVSP
jgi:hypothetical protein